MKQGDILHGFTVRSAKELPEQKAILYRMEYMKNGAELIWLDNGEQNKLFSIAFKTIPTDDTGVFHILEHSVLGGSKKYPVKEPFLSMMKSSMKTFLNAMTFPDKTVYPVSSRNETDFMNLVSVYLDAVFCPTIYDSPFTFYQEGWHYELEDADAQPIYKGVVYNEMKGVFSSVDALAEQGMNRLLFPDSCYRFEAGGDPESIPNLTYEDFVRTHKEFYHPSNAKIYLDGSIPIDRVLTLLDTYLSSYERSDRRYDIPIQQPTEPVSNVRYYAIGTEEEAQERVQMSFGKIVCDYSDRKKLLALSALSSYLTGSNESPLKQTILRSGLAQDVYLAVVDGIYQPYFCLRICNTEYDRKDEIKKTVAQTVGRVLADGLDTDELDAAICQMEFMLREFDEPKGLGRNIAVLNSWLYGGDPELYLNNSELFESLREALKTGYFEDLLLETLADLDQMAELYLLPSASKGDADAEAEKARLAAAKAKWSDKELQTIIQMNREFALWQSAPDTMEAINTLPKLTLDEIAEASGLLTTEQTTIGTVPILFHPTNEFDVISFNLYFSLSDVPREHWGDLSFLTNIIGMLPTENRSAYELQREIKRNIGFIDYNIVVYPVPDHPECCKPYFTVNCSVLKNRLGKALSLITEILSETVYGGEERADMMFDILMQCYESVRQDILENGHTFAMKRASSHMTASGCFAEQAWGFTMYKWLECLVAEFDERISDLQAYLGTVQKTIFAAKRMTVGITADRIPDEFADLIENLQKKGAVSAPDCMTVVIENEPSHEIIIIPSGVSYAASTNHLSLYGKRYSGALRVLSTILSYEYLWNEVRVKGGAYGCGCRTGVTGNIGFYSYRDPSPLSSISVFREADDFIRSFFENGESIENYIISSIAAAEPLESLREQGQNADTDAFCKITSEDRIRIRREMLYTTKEDMFSLCDLLGAMAKDNAVCIVGNADSLRNCGSGWIQTDL